MYSDSRFDLHGPLSQLLDIVLVLCVYIMLSEISARDGAKSWKPVIHGVVFYEIVKNVPRKIKDGLRMKLYLSDNTPILSVQSFHPFLLTKIKISQSDKTLGVSVTYF